MNGKERILISLTRRQLVEVNAALGRYLRREPYVYEGSPVVRDVRCKITIRLGKQAKQNRDEVR